MYNFPSFANRRLTQGRSVAFTLIELIAVMSIILILAGLILGIAGHAQHEASVKRAEAEIKGLSAAIEAYKVDNGAYPRSDATDTLNPQMDFDPGMMGNNKYQLASEYLYQCLSGNQPPVAGATTTTKSYFFFKSNQIASPNGTSTTNANSPYEYIQDPFGFSYGYSTAYLKAADTSSTDPNTATPITTSGYNPTFDLWSTAGYAATGGKGTPTNTGNSSSRAALYSNLWEKNW